MKSLDKTRTICYYNISDGEGNFLIYVAWGTIMEHISTLNAGVYTSMAKRLGMTDIGRLSTHGFIGNLCKNGFTIHLFNSRDVRSFEGRTVNSVPSLTLVVKRFVDGKAADRLSIDVWEYADISKALDAAKAFIG